MSSLNKEESFVLSKLSSDNEYIRLKQRLGSLVENEAKIIPTGKQNLSAIMIPIVGDQTEEAVIAYFNPNSYEKFMILIAKAELDTEKSGVFGMYDSQGQMLFEATADLGKVTSVVYGNRGALSRTEGRGSACSVDGVGYCTGAKYMEQGVIEKMALYSTGFLFGMGVFAAQCAVNNCF